MKRARFILPALVLVLALLLGGCLTAEGEKGESGGGSAETNGGTTAPAENGREEIPFEEGQLYAAAYLGYQQIEDLDYYARRYLDGEQVPTVYVSDGDYYLIIPRYDGMRMTLSVNDIETSLPKLLLEVPDCGPFIVQCNASDVFADVTVTLEREGDRAEFSPYISLENGQPQMGERGLDVTGTDGAPEENETDQ